MDFETVKILMQKRQSINFQPILFYGFESILWQLNEMKPASIAELDEFNYQEKATLVAFSENPSLQK